MLLRLARLDPHFEKKYTLLPCVDRGSKTSVVKFSNRDSGAGVPGGPLATSPMFSETMKPYKEKSLLTSPLQVTSQLPPPPTSAIPVLYVNKILQKMIPRHKL